MKGSGLQSAPLLRGPCLKFHALDMKSHARMRQFLPDMCKFKDINLVIKRIDFELKRGAMAVFLSDGRIVIVPVAMFPEIKRLSLSQRKNYMIMDDQYFSFEGLSTIYSVKDILAY